MYRIIYQLREAPATPRTARLARPWLGMQLRQLAALAAVAEEGSFQRAAGLLGYTQPAISQQVAALERLVGTQLIERGRGERIRPTEAGHILLEHWSAIESQLVAARADLGVAMAGAQAELRVGVYASVGARVLPVVLSEHAARWPGVDVVLHDDIADRELFALVEAGKIELAFATFPLPPGEFESATLFDDPFVLVVRSDSQLSAGIRNRRSLAALPIVCFKDCLSTGHALLLIGEGGPPVEPAFRSNNSGLLQGLVRAGRGVALFPRMAYVPEPDLTAVDLGGLVPPRETGLIWHAHRTLSPAAEAFVETAKKVCAKLR